MSRKDSRGRNWSFVGYPDDSLPTNYREILNDEMHLCYCESPVHDADFNGDGSEKKAHIHFVVSFEGNKSFEQMLEITQRLNCPIPQQVRNMRAMVRYLIHADNPDKHQYKREDVKAFGGFVVDEYFTRSQTENRDVLKEIMSFCVDNGIDDFCDLAEIVFASGNNDWIDIITCRNTLFLSTYMKSKHFKNQLIVREQMAKDSHEKLIARKEEIENNV